MTRSASHQQQQGTTLKSFHAGVWSEEKDEGRFAFHAFSDIYVAVEVAKFRKGVLEENLLRVKTDGQRRFTGCSCNREPPAANALGCDHQFKVENGSRSWIRVYVFDNQLQQADVRGLSAGRV